MIFFNIIMSPVKIRVSEDELLELIFHILEHSFVDTIKMLPFLFCAFLILEILEAGSEKYHQMILERGGKAGPVLGAFLGCFPQCGFSVIASNLYAGGFVTVGTLVAVYLATSDEAILILLSHPDRGTDIIALIGVKVVIAIIAGYLIDVFLQKYISTPKTMDMICHDCGCHEHHGKHRVLLPACKHTIVVFLHLLLFTVIINGVIELIGFDTLSEVLLRDSLFQPVVAAVLGLIPNCAASIMLTQLYLADVISFASVVAGLCSSAGAGLIVLYKVNKNKVENIKISGVLVGIGVLAGIILEIVN